MQEYHYIKSSFQFHRAQLSKSAITISAVFFYSFGNCVHVFTKYCKGEFEYDAINWLLDCRMMCASQDYVAIGYDFLFCIQFF